MPLPEAADRDVAALAALGGRCRARRSLRAPRRAWAKWLLLSLDDADATISPASRRRSARRRPRRGRAPRSAGRDLDQEIIGARYARVDAIVRVGRRACPRPSGPTWTERIDAVLTHRVWGGAVFVAVMLVLFQALFSWSEPAIGLIEIVVARTQDVVTSVLPPGPLRDLIVDGVIAGVGNVIVFVPQIVLLFLFIGVLEDVGLPGARRVPDGSPDGRDRPARPRVRADAVRLLVRGAGDDGDAHRREPHRPPADDDGAAADVVLGAPADLHPDHRDGLPPRCRRSSVS